MEFDDTMPIKIQREHAARASAMVSSVARYHEMNRWAKSSRTKVLRLAMERGLRALEVECSGAPVGGVGSG
ncbi:hypothetical protein HN937_04405 [Candidatus Poribacteria bacterium]|nr:hypothetical protein [Candidatus Poribacteria bacterium]